MVEDRRVGQGVLNGVVSLMTIMMMMTIY